MTAQKNLTLSIIIPAYNESKTLPKLIQLVRSVKLDGIQKQIILVDDGSTDQTAETLRTYGSPLSHHLHHDTKKGKGAAIRTALPCVTGDVVLIQDADLEYSPSDYPRLLAPIIQNHADVVYGSRFPGNREAFSSWGYYIGNKFLSFITNMLYGSHLRDVETGYKVFRGSCFRSLNLKSNGFNFDPEITAKVLKHKFRIIEVPISYHGRQIRDGKKITWWDGVMALICLIHYRIKN